MRPAKDALVASFSNSASSAVESRIPLLGPGGRVVPATAFSQIVESSAWPELVVEQHRCPATELSGLAYQQHVLAFNVGGALTCEYKQDGRWKTARKAYGAVSLFPRGRVFTRRMKTTADVMYLALQPAFFAANLHEHSPAAVDLAEQRRDSDPVLFQLALTLREAARSDLRHDLLFTSSLALALARHLLLQYSTRLCRKAELATKIMSRTDLGKVRDFVQAHLRGGITVAEIARVVHMSPFSFARLFKKTTGQSPYEYVTSVRLQCAQEKLRQKPHSLKELAYDLGFADQSHFTRQFRRRFGITPGEFARTTHFSR